MGNHSFVTVSRHACLVVLSLLTAGCAADHRPKYREPLIPASEKVVLKGTWGTFIESVDGAKVNTGLRLANFGGNQVAVEPGHRRLSVIVETNSNNYSTTRTCQFTAFFAMGRTYEFTRESVFSTRLKLTDKTDGTSTIIE